MRILIDADGCPVVDICIKLAKENGVECHIFCDSSHEFSGKEAEVHTVTKGADSADFALVNFARAGDVAVTQDYGLASMALSRGARVINQDGLEYTNDNIDALLLARHTARKIRSAGGRLRGSARREKRADLPFESTLRNIFKKCVDK